MPCFDENPVRNHNKPSVNALRLCNDLTNAEGDGCCIIFVNKEELDAFTPQQIIIQRSVVGAKIGKLEEQTRLHNLMRFIYQCKKNEKEIIEQVLENVGCGV
jgi:hypothetical protein